MDKDHYQRLFLEESRRHLDAAYGLLRSHAAPVDVDASWSSALMRHVHTIKGMAAALQLERVVALAHQLENHVAPLVPVQSMGNPAFVQTMSDGLSTLDQLIAKVAQDTSLTAHAQKGGARSRMQLIELTGEYIELVHSWGADLHKDVTLSLWGQQLEMPRAALMALHGPLVQLLRNAVDHGIESSQTRQARGKPQQGSIMLRAYEAPPGLRICVSDDGGGLDPHKIAARAVALRMVKQAEADAMDRDAIFALLSRPRFSLADAVTTFSGRGVGLDIVKADLAALGGQLEVTSTLGQGTHFCCYLPALQPA